MNNFNIVAFGSDSYKYSHHGFYPDGLETVYSYCEPRVGARFDETVFFGLQYIISRYLTGQVVTRDKIEEAAAICTAHFGSEEVFNREGWEYILDKCQGRLPVRITAIPEGTVVPTGTALFTIENTDPQVPWLTNFLETLLMQMWSPTTVASSSRKVKKIIARYLEETGDLAGLPFKLHDFGMRGVSSLETAALSGAAHLTSFMGTDTMAALPLLRDYYGPKALPMSMRLADSKTQWDMPGFSIPATEHSVMTSGGPEGEADIVRKVLTAHPTGLVAIVIDSFDTMGFIHNVIGGNEDIMDMIRNREGTVVFRPDSGTLPKIDIDVFEALAEVFGTTVNEKGFRVLPDYVRMIQGDGIKWYEYKTQAENDVWCDHWGHTVADVLEAFKVNGISADNIAFGSGGGLLQDFTRDTQCFAIKCSAMQINGEWVDIFKQPKTDPTKNSKRGRLGVFRNSRGEFKTLKLETVHETRLKENLLQDVLYNGVPMNIMTLDEIRVNAALPVTETDIIKIDGTILQST
jgi:nicotinamide phosphoribosyltransferase